MYLELKDFSYNKTVRYIKQHIVQIMYKNSFRSKKKYKNYVHEVTIIPSLAVASAGRGSMVFGWGMSFHIIGT